MDLTLMIYREGFWLCYQVCR